MIRLATWIVKIHVSNPASLGLRHRRCCMFVVVYAETRLLMDLIVLGVGVDLNQSFMKSCNLVKGFFNCWFW